MPTFGWRFFTINEPRLRSFPAKGPYGYLYSMPGVNRLPPYRWQPYENQPKCDNGCENPPTAGCGCGFYSVDDLEALCAGMARSAPALLAAGLPLALNCVGRIELIGRITTGFKHPLIAGERVAERARIVGPLWLAPGIYYEAARTAERFYEVEVVGTPQDPGRF
ncbi:hypothetical protein [Frankia sp. QA3]|uniref:hypothetical protein n=1 Tax=Frankia sp. QA3 TaxID=710111 RepID=UPI000269B6DE|nr:hypothetical protein [Frankia sp. QA3]EIV90904.1 hypothetical protein FraQA3DRAFT_0316 [Frankia sp. QA3]